MKKKKVLKNILFILLAIILIWLIFTLRKFFIFYHLSNLGSKNISQSNYYSQTASYQGNGIVFTQSYHKDNKYLTTMQFYGRNLEKRKLTIYNDSSTPIGLIESGEDKVALLDGTVVGGDLSIVSMQNMGIFNTFLSAIFSRITIEECNSIPCYLIERSNGWKVWVDKKTGIEIREINSSFVVDRHYEFNQVTDENVQKPDMTGYRVP